MVKVVKALKDNYVPKKTHPLVLENLNKLGPMDIQRLTEAKQLTFEPSFKFLSEWTKYDKFWFIIGQINEKGQPHGISRMIFETGIIIREGQFVNGFYLSGYGRYVSMHGYYIGDWKDDRFHGQGTIYI